LQAQLNQEQLRQEGQDDKQCSNEASTKGMTSIDANNVERRAREDFRPNAATNRTTNSNFGDAFKKVGGTGNTTDASPKQR
jgi:hypothetical protein